MGTEQYPFSVHEQSVKSKMSILAKKRVKTGTSVPRTAWTLWKGGEAH